MIKMNLTVLYSMTILDMCEELYKELRIVPET